MSDSNDKARIEHARNQAANAERAKIAAEARQRREQIEAGNRRIQEQIAVNEALLAGLIERQSGAVIDSEIAHKIKGMFCSIGNKRTSATWAEIAALDAEKTHIDERIEAVKRHIAALRANLEEE